MSQKSIAVVVKGWPRLSETFIAQELVALEEAGFKLEIISLRHPTDKKRHQLHDRLKAKINYLPEYLYQEPKRIYQAWKKVRNLAGYKKAKSAFWKDLTRNPTPNRVRRFGQALVMAAEMAEDCGWIYTHFLHTPTSVGRYAAMITNKGWSFSAHAKDIWTNSEWDKKDKLRDCAWGATCTAVGQSHLNALVDEHKVRLIYHGLDFSRFPAEAPEKSSRDGRDVTDPVRLITVCRAVEKKGLPYLFEALASIPEDMHWTWTHIGGGELLPELKQKARDLGIAKRITWLGAMSQKEVIAELEKADIFTLPCIIGEDGDRDGLPNVLMEAQNSALTCVSTNVSSVPELIEHGKTGLLVEQRDSKALAESLMQLIRNADERLRLGAAGRERVRDRFAMQPGIEDLSRLFVMHCPDIAPVELFQQDAATNEDQSVSDVVEGNSQSASI